MMTLTWYELGCFLLLYSFFGWLAEAAFFALTKRRFYNRGVLTLPLLPSHGVTFTLLILNLPSFGGNHVFQFLATMAILTVVEALSDFFFLRISPKLRSGLEREQLFSGSKKGLLFSALLAGVYYLVYLMIHPCFWRWCCWCRRWFCSCW